MNAVQNEQCFKNCPHCGLASVTFHILNQAQVHTDTNVVGVPEKRYIYFLACMSCHRVSLHASKYRLETETSSSLPKGFPHASGSHSQFRRPFAKFSQGQRHVPPGYVKTNLPPDEIFEFYFPNKAGDISKEVPGSIRNSLTEALRARSFGLVTSASACLRKALYKLLQKEGAEGKDTKARINALATAHPSIADEAEALKGLNTLVSNQIHETDWKDFSTTELDLLFVTIESVLHEIYVVPAQRQARKTQISQAVGEANKQKKSEDS